MSIASSAPWRGLLLALLMAFFVLSLLGNWGGPDLLGDAQSAIWGLILSVWFGWELRRESGRWTRRILYFGIAVGVLLIVSSVADLVFG